ncbi:hypothetical protein FGG08_000414 [Glutinoglossum americanum]|uniref:Mitochondrial thiamine pyrophosphate carrier 1 n=1 Tax=Glutinoglossum americanum TaxID=1670608 RepID=A0A9P8IDJ2_9PEZI|nr:hypothetical protein FGG08_000414 [Glutinoglossum americanum]
MESGSQKSIDSRVERLWQILDTRKEGELDLNALKKGLKKLDHPLKNADPLLKDILEAVDTSGDGRIQYEEFRNFVEETEKELRILFNSIDRDHNGRLDKDELRAAFAKAGLVVSNSKLDQFFSEVDTNHDGEISFEEWRDFLLFIPQHTPGLKAVLSYFSSTVTVNPEGDVQISDEKAEGLGTPIDFPSTFLGAISSIYAPHNPYQVPKRAFAPLYKEAARSVPTAPASLPWPAESPQAELPTDISLIIDDFAENMDAVLTTFQSGYFLAGGIAGAVSRTATAPFDRLRVYLIAQTSVGKQMIGAAKQGEGVQAVKSAGRPLIGALKAIWKAGGVRSLFAGNGLNVLKVMPESAIRFGSYEAAKGAFAKFEGHNDPKQISNISKYIAGGIGGVVSQFSVYPIDTLKFRMQCSTVEGGLRGNKLIVDTAKKMWTTGGVRTYYRGLPMGLVGIFPYSAIDLGTFEYLKRMIASKNAKRRGCHEDDAAPGSFITAGIGAVSGALGASIMYPLNLLRTRLQTQGTVLHPPTYTGVWDVTEKTLRREGFRGLFKGLTPSLLKVVPSVSIRYFHSHLLSAKLPSGDLQVSDRKKQCTDRSSRMVPLDLPKVPERLLDYFALESKIYFLPSTQS